MMLLKKSYNIYLAKFCAINAVEIDLKKCKLQNKEALLKTVGL